MKRIYLGLGANVGIATAYIAKAVELLQQEIHEMKVSPLYVTRPWGVSDQPNFVNGALYGLTDLTPTELRAFTKGVEDRLGRRRHLKNGPREIDIDILLYEDWVFDDGSVKVPHTGLITRDFVMQPLLDLEPALCDPVTKMSLSGYLSVLHPNDRYIVGLCPPTASKTMRTSTITLKSVLPATYGIKELDAFLFEDVLDQESLQWYVGIAKALNFTEQAKEFGKRRVRQDVWSAPVVPHTELDQLADSLQAMIARVLGPGAFETPLMFNQRNIQRYADGSHGIDPHKDHHHNYNLVALFGLAGEGLFTLYSELGSPPSMCYRIVPNSLLLMKAPGFLGEQTCPWHGVSQIVGGDDGHRYLLGLRQNDQPVVP